LFAVNLSRGRLQPNDLEPQLRGLEGSVSSLACAVALKPVNQVVQMDAIRTVPKPLHTEKSSTPYSPATYPYYELTSVLAVRA
jgi:hypothetical protein